MAAVARKPAKVIPVRNLAESLAFYVDTLGCKLVAIHPDAAHLETPVGHVLLAGPDAGDVGRYAAPSYKVLKPGAVIYVFTPDIEETARRLPGAARIRTEWGERKLELADPNGYTISYWTESDLTDGQLLALFASAPERLEAALAGLRYAIAEPGRLYRPNAYDPDVWDAGPCSDRRPVQPSVALLRAVHGHLLQLIAHVPGALDRYTVNEAGSRQTVRRMVWMLGAHAAGHVEQIWITRRVHGI